MELDSIAASYGASSIYQTAFVRDSAGHITQSSETIQGTTTVSAFTYDSLSRLLTVSRNGVAFHSFVYDSNGNRKSLTSASGTVNGSYDSQDRLLSYGTTNYTYISNGELRTKQTSTGTTTYTYDALGNLVTAVLENGTRIDYVLDAFNRRVGKKVNGILIRAWIYQDLLKPVAEFDGTGHLVSRFVFAASASVPSYMTKGGHTYAVIADYEGSVRLVVDSATGAVAQRIDYDEFGQVTANTSPGFQPFGYAGGLLDDDTQLERFGARDYDAFSGRWTARDPTLFAGGGANLYQYAQGDPINFVDPNGEWFIGAGIGFVVGFGSGVLGTYAGGGGWSQAWRTGLVDGAAGAFMGFIDPSEGVWTTAEIGGEGGLATMVSAEIGWGKMENALVGGLVGVLNNVVDQELRQAYDPAHMCDDFNPLEAGLSAGGGLLGGQGLGQIFDRPGGSSGLAMLGSGILGSVGSFFGGWGGDNLAPPLPPVEH